MYDTSMILTVRVVQKYVQLRAMYKLNVLQSICTQRIFFFCFRLVAHLGMFGARVAVKKPTT